MPIVNPSIRSRKVPGMKGPGDLLFGRIGGQRTNPAFIMSYKVSERLAARLGMTHQQAYAFVIGFGQVVQELLFEGTPVGIPHCGVLEVRQRKRGPLASAPGIAAAMAKRGRVRGAAKLLANAAKGGITTHNYVRFDQSQSLRRMFADNLMFTGPLRDHFKVERERIARIGSQRKGHRAKHPKGP